MHAEVGGHRLLDLHPVPHDHPGERLQHPLALLQRRIRVVQERRPLTLDDLLEFSDRGAIGAGRRGLVLSQRHRPLL